MLQLAIRKNPPFLVVMYFTRTHSWKIDLNSSGPSDREVNNVDFEGAKISSMQWRTANLLVALASVGYMCLLKPTPRYIQSERVKPFTGLGDQMLNNSLCGIVKLIGRLEEKSDRGIIETLTLNHVYNRPN